MMIRQLPCHLQTEQPDYEVANCMRCALETRENAEQIPVGNWVRIKCYPSHAILDVDCMFFRSFHVDRSVGHILRYVLSRVVNDPMQIRWKESGIKSGIS